MRVISNQRSSERKVISLSDATGNMLYDERWSAYPKVGQVLTIRQFNIPGRKVS